MVPRIKKIRNKISLLLVAIVIGSWTSYKLVPQKEKQFSANALSQKLIALNGDTVPFETILARHKGKVAMIEIWASWCGDCVKAMPKLKEVQASNPNVDYIFVSMDKTADKWKEGIDKHQLDGRHYWAADGMKGAFGNAIDLDWIPRYIIIDKSGNVALYRAVETDFEKINLTLKKLAK